VCCYTIDVKELLAIVNMILKTHGKTPLRKQPDVELLIRIAHKFGLEAFLKAWTMREPAYLEAFLSLTSTPTLVPKFHLKLFCDGKVSPLIHTPKRVWTHYKPKALATSWEKSDFNSVAAKIVKHFATKTSLATFTELLKSLRDKNSGSIYGAGMYGTANFARILYLIHQWCVFILF
jgi:hypothetical protein